jgi:phosphatidylinositol-3-phosphatase
VIVIVMENKSFGQIIGSREAPYINALARRYGLALDYHAITHPSLPNYLALLGGSTFDIRSNCTGCHVDAPNLVDRLEKAGISWKAYMEGMPSPCFQGAVSGRYAKKHNPFVYFDDIVNRPARCRKVVPLNRLHTDLQSGGLPQFGFIIPDLCHDMHDCSVSVGDRFLRTLLPPILRALGPTGVLFLTWEEGDSDLGCCRFAQGGHVPMIVAGPAARQGARSPLSYSHYSLLRTIEDAWGLSRLRRAGCTCSRPLGAFF